MLSTITQRDYILSLIDEYAHASVHAREAFESAVKAQRAEDGIGTSYAFIQSDRAHHRALAIRDRIAIALSEVIP